MDQLPDISSELIFNTSRSSGPGGQNVNKLETKVEVRWDIAASILISDKVKNKLLSALQNKLVQQSTIIISAQESRSQSKNKSLAITKLMDLLNESLKEDMERKTTKPPKGVKEERLKEKKKESALKKFRGNLKSKLNEEM